jgi:RND family efflux transporter MFP subunit
MNNHILYSTFIVFLIGGAITSCTNEPKGDLDQLIAKRDSLLNELTTVETRISEIDTAHLSEPALVTIDTVQQGTFEHFIEIQGIVEADKNLMITSEIPAIIKKIHVREGQKVKKGTLMVTLDDEMIDNQIKELQTQFKLANYIYEKQTNLRKENIGSELDYEKAKNNKEYLESALRTAEAQKGKAKIRAVYDGVVDQIFPEVGELTGPQMPLIRFISLGNASIKVDVPESYLNKIKVGDLVSVSFPDLGKTFTSKINNRGNFIEPLNRTFKISIDLPVDDNILLPNLIGVVKITDLIVDNALLIKTDNILQDAKGNNYVFLIQQNEDKIIARKVFIEIGESYGNITYVQGGLKASDIIVSQGARSIIDGEEVKFEGIHVTNGNLSINHDR